MRTSRASENERWFAAVAKGLPRGVRVHVLAEPGRQHGICFSGGKQVRLDPETPAGSYRAEWVNTRTGQTEKDERIGHAGGWLSISSPSCEEDIALRLRIG